MVQGFARALGAALFMALFIAAAPCPAFAEMPASVAGMCDVGVTRPGDSEAAQGISRPAPVYPQDEIDAWSEGWARFLLTIAADGSTKDIVALDRIGPAGFVAASIDALKKWRYRPAMLHGKPVAQYGNSVVITFIFEQTSWGERKSFSDLFARYYDRARDDAKAGRNAEAIEGLTKAFKLKLDLYEQAMGSYVMALALIGVGQQNWHDALTYIRHADADNEAYLDATVKGPVVDLDVALEARDGNYDGAICTYLRAGITKVQVAPATVQLAEKIGALLAAPAPLVIPAEVFANGPSDAPAALPPAWIHPLLRDKFSFSGIKGSAKSLRLVCTSTVLEAQVNEETQWSVPPDAGHCLLFVFADPGTTFQLIEGG